MTATLEETQADLLKFLRCVQQGAEVVITSQGRPVAKLTGVPQTYPTPNRQVWLDHLAELRQRLATGASGVSVEQSLEEGRGE